MIKYKPGLLSAICLLVFILSAGLVYAQKEDPSSIIVLQNANVMDGISESMQRNRTIIIKDRLIQSIQGEEEIPDGATVIDLKGHYVLPGLIDAHAHVQSLSNAERALMYGTTTLRSASVGSYADVAMQALVDNGSLAGPEIVPAGLFVQPDLGESILADPELAELYEGVESEEALRRLVRVNIKNGVKVIKTRSAERAGTPETDPRKQVYTEEQLRFIVDEASKAGIPVMAHAHGAVGAAVRAGVRSIEHGTYATREELQLMKEKGTFLVPTYSTVEDLTMPGGDYDHPVTTIRGQYLLPQMEKTVKAAHALGVPVVASTDSGYGPESLTRVTTEVINFVKLGMSPLEAIRSAGMVAAKLLQIEQRTGSVEEGKEADLIVVYENPIQNIEAIQDIILVISNGKVALNRLPFEE